MIMKKYFLTLILMAAITLNAQFAFAANEVVEDYLDIATSYAVSGNYASAMDYLNLGTFLAALPYCL